MLDILSEVGGVKAAFMSIIWLFFNAYNYKRHDLKVL